MAARRFGGPHSPNAPPAPEGGRPSGLNPVFRGARRTRAGARANLMFVVPGVFVLTAFRQPPAGLALDLAAFGTLMLAAWLTREGLIAEDAYEARTVARRPAFPRKILGSVLTGLGLGLGGYVAGGGLRDPAIFAVLGAVLHAAAFGLDPLKDKGAEGIDAVQTNRVARAVEEAERHLAAMADAIRRVPDRALAARVERFQAAAREMFRAVEADPRDLTAARRYLGVYLLGARDATAKFADLYARGRDPQVRAAYMALLDDLEANFAARTRALLQNDRSDLDIEIEVLRERLGREGIRPD